MKIAPIITLSEEERKTLESWSRGRSTQARLVLRAKIVLAAASGKTNEVIAMELGTAKATVRPLADPLRQVANGRYPERCSSPGTNTAADTRDG